jgi:O-antigen/teichoic acid export membrane protein
MIQKFSSFFFDNEILQKSSVSFLLQIAGSLFGYSLLLLVTRKIGASSWGVFVLFLSILNISSIFARLGVDMFTLKWVSASSTVFDKVKAIYFSSFRLVLFSSTVVSLILYLTAESIAECILHDSSFVSIIRWIAYVLPLFAITSVNENTFRGLKMIKEYAFFQRTAKMFFAVIFFVIFYYGFKIRDSQLVVFSYILGLVIIFISSTFFIFRIIKSSNFSKYINSKEMIRQSIPMMMSSSALLLMSWADSLMIASFKGEYELGIYNVAVKVALLTSFTLSAVNSIAAPKISKAFNNEKEVEFRNIIIQTTKTIFFSTIPIIVVIFLFPEFILNFFGEEFLLAKTALLILAFSQVLNAMSGSVGVILTMTGKEKVYRNILLFALVINITLNFLLIPEYGIEGAAIASASSLIFWNLYSVYYVYRNYNILTFISFRNE